MIARPDFYAREKAPVTDTYVLVDRSGRALGVAVRCEAGERLPEVVVTDSNPIGYVRAHRIVEHLSE